MIASISLGVGACGAKLPEVSLPTAEQLVSNAHATTIVGRPDEIYQRIASKAAQCWFGPFGQLHTRFMMHADLPPPSSSAPVTLTVHRRLANRKKPWGPSVLRLELTGTTSTTLAFANLGLKPAVHQEMTRGMTRWANGGDACGNAFETPAGDGAGTEGIATGATTKKR